MKKLTPTGVQGRLRHILKRSLHSPQLKKTICATGLLLSAYALQAQIPALKPLSIGDTVPEVQIDSLMNYSTPIGRLDDFKSELLLLDFWSTWCKSCIAGFPKMDSLQKQFHNLQIVLVNAQSKTSNDDARKIKNTLERVRDRTGVDISLPVIYANDRLDSLFPVSSIPQVAWIQKNKVIAITNSDQVTPANITVALTGRSPNLYTNQARLSFDSNKPLFVNGNGGYNDQILFRSLITGYIPGIGMSKGQRVENNKVVGYYLFNQSLESIVEAAYKDLNLYPANRTIIESANKHLQKSNDPSFKYEHSFCYELVIPPSDQNQLIQYMKEDVSRYFRVTAANEVRKIKCLVLTHYTPHDSLLNNATLPTSIDIAASTRKKHIYNRNIPFIVRILNQYTPLPVIDETNAAAPVFLDLPFEMSDFKALKKVLLDAGFELSEEERNIEVTVIKDL